jgi:aspartate/methionine/tyrosine aminotransferase
MSYQQFRALRDRLLAERDLLRLDCMNPAKALSALAPPPTETRASAGEALRAWLDLFAPAVDPNRAAVTIGARPALQAIFSHLATSDGELWLPEDVYPVYQELASAAGLHCHPIVTLPTLDLSSLSEAGAGAALLLPQPLAPAGRYFTDRECQCLGDWLTTSPRRRLILDTVYHFDNRLDPAARSLWETGQTYLVHSLAKGWLLPDTLGVTLTPPDGAAEVQRQLMGPSQEEAGRAADALRRRPQMPHEVEGVFRRQWAALSERIGTAVPGWKPPATGYFSVVAAPFATLLERDGMLAVPASVFGSRRDDLSVLTCLYYPA